jgi:hypothetical protein
MYAPFSVKAKLFFFFLFLLFISAYNVWVITFFQGYIYKEMSNMEVDNVLSIIPTISFCALAHKTLSLAVSSP